MRRLFNRGLLIVLAIALTRGVALGAEQPFLQLDTGGHMAIVSSVVFTPDGKFVVSAGDDKVIRIWDWRAGKTVRILRGEARPGDEGKIYAIALSPDGHWLAAGGWTSNNEIRLYDFNTGELRGLFKGHTNVVHSLAFSPNSKRLISGSSDKDAIIWEVETRQVLHRLKGHENSVYAVGFTNDGIRAVTGSFDKTLRIWNVARGTLQAEMKGHAGQVRTISISPVDNTIASGDTSGEIRLWNPATGDLKKVLVPAGGNIGSLRYSPDGRLLLATCGGGGCSETPQRILDAATGKVLIAYTKHDNTVIGSAFSRDGSMVATAGGEKFPIHVWDPKTGETEAVLKGTGKRAWSVAFSQDGRSIAWGGGRDYKDNNNRGPLDMTFKWPGANVTLAQPEPLANSEGWIRAQTNHGPLSLAHRTEGGYDSILDVLKDGKHSGVTIHRDATNGLGFYSYTFTPDGRTILAGGGFGGITAYGLDGKELPKGEFVGHESVVWALAVSPDGKYLVSGSGDQTVRLWNVQTRELLATLFRGEDGEWVMYTPEGFYTGSEGGEKLVGWQINQGPDKAAHYVTAGQLGKQLLRPDLIAAKIAGDPDGILKEAVTKLKIEDLVKQVLAPEIEIVSPADGAKGEETVTGGKLHVNVSVTVRVADKGGGIGVVRFKLNGQVVDSVVAGRPGTITRSFDLANQDTKIEVIAEDKSGKVLSVPKQITVHAESKALLGVPDLYVLAIGVDRYKDERGKLQFAVKDATSIGDALKKAGEGYYRDPPIVKPLYDEQVTAQNVDAAFKELSQKVKATDVFLLYMAGHGKTVDGDYYFLPRDVSDFSDENIKAQGFGPAKMAAWFSTIKALKSIWIFDTCDAGSAIRIPGLLGARDVGSEQAGYKRLRSATGRAIFMATSDLEQAKEGYNEHGLFTYAFLEGLALAGDQRSNEVDIADLKTYVEKRVPELSRQLQACGAQGADEYCQKPLVPILGDGYTLAPRYMAILSELSKTPTISRKPTHALMAATDLFDTGNRGTPAKRQLQRGDLVTVIRVEGGWAQVAQNGQAIGYVEESALLPLNY